MPVGEAFPVTLILMYAPSDIYSNVVPGATFTLREGGKVVGHGEIKNRWQETA